MLAEAVMCLALNVFHEARGDTLKGQEAVALVTRNRAHINGHGICWEVFRYKQFSWTLSPSKLRRVPTGRDWDHAVKVAQWALGPVRDFTGGATHYYLASDYPYWASSLTRLGQWGDHVFYK